jgi:hypothetical protein
LEALPVTADRGVDYPNQFVQIVANNYDRGYSLKEPN